MSGWHLVGLLWVCSVPCASIQFLFEGSYCLVIPPDTIGRHGESCPALTLFQFGVRPLLEVFQRCCGVNPHIAGWLLGGDLTLGINIQRWIIAPMECLPNFWWSLRRAWPGFVTLTLPVGASLGF